MNFSRFSSLSHLNSTRYLRHTYCKQWSRIGPNRGNTRWMTSTQNVGVGKSKHRVYLWTGLTACLSAGLGYTVYTAQPWDHTNRRKIRVQIEGIGRFFRYVESHCSVTEYCVLILLFYVCIFEL